MRPRIHNNPNYAHLAGGKNKRTKKHKHLSMLSSANTYVTNEQNGHQSLAPDHSNTSHKGHNRRQGRDKRREEKRKALEAHATQAVDTAENDDLSRQDTLIPTSPTVSTTNAIDTDILIVNLESLHVSPVEESSSITNEDEAPGLLIATTTDELEDDNDVFATPLTAIPSFPTFSASRTAESHFDEAVINIVGAMGAAISGNGDAEKEKQQSRLIVEALVVRKMSIEEAFLDFGGFSLT
jgi:hypothetical protein